MITTPTAQAVYTKLCSAPAAWWTSKQGRTLQARAYRMVRQNDGRKAAVELRNALGVAQALVTVIR